MALNLSTLTSPATSGDVLAEALTTADFLEPVPVLRNLARGSQKGGDAKQDVALNQPKALPLIKNPQGKLGGYLYIPNVSGNYATGPSVTIGSNQTWEAEVDMVITQFGNFIQPMGGGPYFTGFGLLLYADGSMRLFSKHWAAQQSITGITLNKPFNLKYGHDGTDLYANIDGNRVYTTVAPSQSSSITHTLEIAQQALTHAGNYAIQKAKLTVNNAVVFDCDFNGSTSIRHGDTKFQCATGQIVTINQDSSSSNDVATIIKKSVLRFDGVNDNLKGLLGTTVTEGYAFLTFSVLGGGGEQFATCFGLNSTGGSTISTDGYAITHRNSERLQSFNSNVALDHTGLFDDSNRDILHEVKFKSGSQISKINNADLLSSSATTTINSEEFSIAERVTNGLNTAIDLEFLALFPATITDAQADSVRNYINNRNNVFDLKDGFGYYFYDATKAPVGPITTGSASWNGRIVGSDNGDSDRYATQGTTNDAPVSDGYVVTFADNSDHLDIPSTTQAGWQVVGTSLGTFVYRVDSDAVTEINLLGNLGNATYRKAGDLYGVILLPESATGADIEDARKLLIDRGAADGAFAGSLFAAWYGRADIVNFKHVNTSSVTAAHFAWYSCNSLNEFPALDLSNSNRFESSWQGCSALTSFPAGAKLGTSASNVNFTSAFQSSGLTSFPALDLSTGTNFASAFQSSDLASFPAGINMSNGTNFANTWRDTDIVEFPLLNLDKSSVFLGAWRFNNLMTTFPAGFFDTWNPGSMNNFVFNDTWAGCTALTAQSVENILVSIDASGQYATSNGASGSSAITDTGIDISYNVSTGSLSAATDAAIDSLIGKGWQVFINGVLTVPAINNILVLSPAAAYSLRSFDSNDDPNVVNVRRSNDNATSDFTASEVSDGTLVAFVGAGNDGLVTTWYDQGGTNHANQIIASRQPKIVNGGALVTEGGLAALDFDGSNDYLKMTSNVFAENLEVAIVNHLQDGSSSNPRLITLSNGTDDNFMVLHQKSTDYLLLRCHSSEGGATTSSRFGAAGVIDDYNLIYATSKLSSDSYTCSVDGVSQSEVAGPAVGSGSYSISTIGVRSDIFSGSYITGTIQEVIVYDTDQSANRLGIAANINDHFDIYS
jgi:hypothetical protein